METGRGLIHRKWPVKPSRSLGIFGNPTLHWTSQIAPEGRYPHPSPLKLGGWWQGEGWCMEHLDLECTPSEVRHFHQNPKSVFTISLQEKDLRDITDQIQRFEINCVIPSLQFLHPL